MLFTAVPRMLTGGVGNIFTCLSQRLPELGCTVYSTWGRPCGEAVRFDELPMPVRFFQGRLAAITYACHSFRFLVLLYHLLRRLRPHIVNLHFVHARLAQVFIWMRPFLKYRLVLSAHGSDIFRPKEGNEKWLLRVLPKVDAIVAVTPSLKERISNFSRVRNDRVILIPNGIDYSFWGVDSTTTPKYHPATVVTVGQLRHVKGQDVLLKSWPGVLERHPDAKLLIVGEGPRRNTLERLAVELQIENTVSFKGQLDAKKIRSILQRASVFAMPSRSEAMPLALLEAMACGLPSVATRVGGVPDILSDDAGVVIEPEDPDALARAINLLLEKSGPAGRFIRAGRERTRRYTSAAMVDSYYQLFRRLTENRVHR